MDMPLEPPWMRGEGSVKLGAVFAFSVFSLSLFLVERE